MKSLKIATLILTLSTNASAEKVEFISDGTELSKVCVLAIASLEEARLEARNIGLSSYEWHSLQCNGMSLRKFARNYSLRENAPRGYTFKSGDKNPATELCIAAIKSPQHLDQLAKIHFGKLSDATSSLECNGSPLAAFLRRYRDFGIANVE